MTGRGQADAILLKAFFRKSVKMLHSPMLAPLVALVLWSFRNVGLPARRGGRRLRCQLGPAVVTASLV
jgi:hypothetical protein